MSKDVKFYECKKCRNLVELIQGESENIKCCDENMRLLNANTTDAATEKHVPVYEKDGDEIIVRVGDIEHPMEADHYIMWIAEVSENKTIRVTLNPGDKTETRFPYIPGATLFAYCNKHGLWKNEVE